MYHHIRKSSPHFGGKDPCKGPCAVPPNRIKRANLCDLIRKCDPRLTQLGCCGLKTYTSS